MTIHDDEKRTGTLQLVGAYQTLLREKRWQEWIDLWADDGELDFPFAPEGRQRTYRGKDEILTYMSGTPGRVVIDAVEKVKVFPMQDPEVAVVELEDLGGSVMP